MKRMSLARTVIGLALGHLTLGCGGSADLDDAGAAADGSPMRDAADGRVDQDAGDENERDGGADAGPMRDAAPPVLGPPGAAFPGAEGWGTDTVGGRAGAVLIVTTTSWDGPGSFSEALYTEGPRTIVFEVSGVIDVPDVIDTLGPEHSYLTVAGQTSPGGITFRGTQVGGSTISSYQPSAPDDAQLHDVVFRHLRFRGQGNTDNFTIAGAHHVVIDHCDFSGADDEALDITYAHDVTVSWSTITNSGPGSQYGFLLAYAPTTRVSYHHNLSANHLDRCGATLHWGDGGTPPGGALIDLRNNVLHNCAYESFFHVYSDGGDARINFVGNTMRLGPQSGSVGMLGLEDGVSVYLLDNDFGGRPLGPGWTETKVDNGTVTVVTTPHEAAPVTTSAAGDAYAAVLARAGAWPRDAMNSRTIGQVEAGTGTLSTFDDALIMTGPAAPADTDRDGMPDAWESARGLVVGVDDSADDDDGDGWTNLDAWLAERAAIVEGG